jgi:hypothetical protein
LIDEYENCIHASSFLGWQVFPVIRPFQLRSDARFTALGYHRPIESLPTANKACLKEVRVCPVLKE